MQRARAILLYNHQTTAFYLPNSYQHRLCALSGMPSVAQMSTTAPSHPTNPKAAEAAPRCGAGGRELPELYKSVSSFRYGGKSMRPDIHSTAADPLETRFRIV
jgi:hypothetical protein